MSSSSSQTSNATETTDGRVAGDNGAIGVSASDGAIVDIQVVPDEAFHLGEMAIRTVADTLGEANAQTFRALRETQDAARTEAAQISDQVIKLGIPAAVIAFIAARYLE